jgi:hypothetical protein
MPNLIAWGLSNIRAIALVAAIVFIYGAGWKTHSLIYEAREARVIKAAQDLVIEKQKEWIKSNEKADYTYQQKINALRKRYDDLVRLRTGNNHLPGVAPPTGLDNAGAGAKGLPWNIPKDIDALMFQADEQTQRLIACQDWIKAVMN